MRFGFLVVVLTTLLCGCGKHGKAPAESGKEAPSGDKESGSQVKISEAAQRNAGIEIASVEARSVSENLTASGQIVPNEDRTVHIGTYTDGRVIDVFARVGDHVTKGQVLARMHSHNVHESRADYQTATQELARNQTARDYAIRVRDRMRRLFDLRSASQQEVERAEADLRSAEVDVHNAEISLREKREHLMDLLNIPDDQPFQLEAQSEFVPIRATLAGTVMERNVTPGSVVEPGENAFTITDLSTVWMMASVNETDVHLVHVNLLANVISQADSAHSIKGRVTQLGTQLDPETRTLQVRILLPNDGMRLRPGMYANAQMERGESQQAIFVPELAVQDINGGSVVFVRRGTEMFEPRPVEVARRINGQAQIRAGLQGGDVIVVKGSFVVKSELLKSQIGES